MIMTHQIKKRATKVPVHRAGFHKLISDWKKTGGYPHPSDNEEDFYKEVMDEAQEYIDKFDKGEMTADDLTDKMDEIAQGIMENDESEAGATVLYGKNDEDIHTIGNYHNDTEGDFWVTWHSTDAWRGYYDVESKKWTNVHSDNILSYSEDSEDLKKFDEALQDALVAKHIEFARVFTRSSNVFSNGYDFFVPKEEAKKVEGIAKNLAKKFRDPDKYEFTVLTGANPSEATPHDKMFVEAVHELKKGGTPESAVKKVLEKHKAD